MNIQAHNIQVAFGSKTILHDVSLDIRDKEFVGIIGPNGSGKSTFLKCLYRVLQPNHGKIFFDGTEWVTPTTFLLNGTCRQRLLSEGKIKERIIHATDIPSFTHIGLINAMIGLGELCLPLNRIFIDE